MGFKDWFKSKNKKPETNREIATTGDGQDITKGYVGALAQPEDGVLRGRGNGDLSLYENVLSDEEVKRTFTQRQDALVSREWTVEPASDEPQDVEAADFIRNWVAEIGFDRITKLMHYGIFYGYAVAELVYRVNDDGKYVADVKVRNRRRFRFTPKGELRLLTRANQTTGIECPAPYFWSFCTGADHDDEPYGIGLAHWLYWLSFFKRNGVKFWLIFLEKFGMPTVLGRYGKNASEADQKRLLEAVESIQSDSGIVMPLDMPIELLSQGRTGNGSYKELFDTMNEGIQRVVLGQTSSSGGTAGRLGNDDLQEKVLESIIKADSDVICESFNRGPVTWLTEMNFANARPPRVFRVFDEAEDLKEKANRDKIIFETTGYRPTLGQIQASYGGEWEKAESPNNDDPAPKEPTKKTADFAGETEKDIPGHMVDQLDNNLAPVIDNWVSQVRALAERAESLEQLRDELLTLMPNMSLEQYTAAMALALNAANLSGREAAASEAVMNKATYGSVPFNEQIEFYKRKIPTPTATWTDIYNAEHDYAAVVAGANRREIIEDFANAIQDFIANGKTLEDFRKDFDNIVAKYGWDYHGGRNWRSRVIYETNLRSSYQAGRYAQLQELKDVMPYWEYVHSDSVSHPRIEHMHWDGLILRHDDPWWQTHFPINAWGCQCTVIGRSQAYMDRNGLKVDKAPKIEWEERIVGARGLNPRIVKVPKGIDPGFEHIPGASRLTSQTPPPLDDGGQPRRVEFYPHRKDTPIPMPTPRKVSSGLLLPEGKDDRFYINEFLSEFGATTEKPVVFKDILGESLVISDALFTSRSGHSKVKKRGREVYLKILALALKTPDEIWTRAEYHHHLNLTTVRRRYIARFELDDSGHNVPALAVFDVGSDGWDGVTIFAPEKDEYLEQVRTGVMLYYRDDED